MSRTVLAALLLLLAPVALPAQAGESRPAATPQEPRQDPPQSPPQDPQAAYDALVRAFNQAMSDWQTAYEAAVQKAQAAGDREPAKTPPTKDFIAKAQALAAAFAGKDDAVRFLAFIVKSASTERAAVRKAVETLASDHARSKAIADVLPALEIALRLGARKPVMALLDDVASNHADADCKAGALLVRGGLRLQTAETDAQRAEGAKDLRQVAELTKDEDLLAQAKDALFEVENLQVGCKAPDIAGVDVEGVPFKLSDYRGKVVLLDFWGFW